MKSIRSENLFSCTPKVMKNEEEKEEAKEEEKEELFSELSITPSKSRTEGLVLMRYFTK